MPKSDLVLHTDTVENTIRVPKHDLMDQFMTINDLKCEDEAHQKPNLAESPNKFMAKNFRDHAKYKNTAEFFLNSMQGKILS